MNDCVLKTLTADEQQALLASLHEQLSVLGLQVEFDRAVGQDDPQRLFELLRRTDIGEDDSYRVLFYLGRQLDRDLAVMIAERYSGKEWENAKRLTAEYKDITSRVLKCAVYASKGDLGLLKQNLDLAVLDSRDVIVMGEYERLGKKLVKIRDFSGWRSCPD